MHVRHFIRAHRRRLGTSLALLGVTVWITAAALHVTPANVRDVTFPHMEVRLLGIVTGGASVAGGIILMATA
jgi:hypothetical protein